MSPLTKPRMYIACSYALIACLASCASVPETVSVPIAVSCVPASMPNAPKLTPNSDMDLLDDYSLVVRIAAERLELAAYASAAASVIEACR